MAFSLSFLLHLGTKFGRALLDIPSLLRPTRQPKLIMTLLVKNFWRKILDFIAQWG